MDLPPSSYHDCLEELSDEEEDPEVETAMKVTSTGMYSPRIIQRKSVHSPVSCFPLNEEALSQFHQLNEAFTIAPVLSHFDPSLPTIVETHASDYALGAVLSQISDSGKHPIAFDSHKLLPAGLNYEIHAKELLGIVQALKGWRAFLLSLYSSFEVLTNHSSLQYFMSSKILTCCQARWAEFLPEFHFSITYRPGRLATLPGCLSRDDNVYPERGEDFIRKNPMNYQKIIKQDEIQASKFCAVKLEAFSILIESIQNSLWQDSQYRSILQDLGKGKSPLPREDSQTYQAGFPLLWHDSIYHGLCIILSTVFKKQKYSSQEVWTPQASSNSKWSLDLSFNGFHHSFATVELLGLNPCHSGQILKNGSFYSNNVFNHFTRFGPFIHQEYFLKAWPSVKHC
ncbi:hypothetical protein O181_035812 [Austropuccinia psidii MF-1]|uniref:Reverse transcriptase RNase H-like domain-containing protein n=1 Tax=Austropuccinia psidii MF-1 TaxID=1389203 RepID=A0A9Q3D9E2_9BASI|nr:hypothetical protein [Austropuccinia psidii MF-1]